MQKNKLIPLLSIFLSNVFLYFGLYNNQFFFIISFGLFSFFLYFFFQIILNFQNQIDSSKSETKINSNNEKDSVQDIPAEEHPIIISARQRLGKEK